MADSVPGTLLSPDQVARQAAARRSGNGIAFSTFGETNLDARELTRLVEAVPVSIARSIERSAYFFVPLALGREHPARDGRPQDEETLVAPVFTSELSEQATCHRNVLLGETDAVFISTRLLADRFALSFEFFIHIGHAFADAAGVPETFQTLAWQQATAGTRGETSQDAWELRTRSIEAAATSSAEAPGLRSDYLAATFADALAIYLLSLTVDFDYSELREREYPLLAPAALGERLRLIASLYPPNAGYEFSIRYRRRT